MADATKTLITLGAVAVGGYLIYEYLNSSCKTNPSGAFCSFFTPGTTSSTQNGTTNVGTTPPSTIQIPTAAQLQAAGNTNISSADGWNWVFTQLFGIGIDQLYGFSFDQVYGGQPRGQISAQAFLQLPSQFGLSPKKSTLSGLGAFVHFQGPHPLTQANMIFGSHHPLPYASTYTFRGLGALTHTTGFERALWAGRPLHRSRLFGTQVIR